MTFVAEPELLDDILASDEALLEATPEHELAGRDDEEAEDEDEEGEDTEDGEETAEDEEETDHEDDGEEEAKAAA